MGVVVQFSYAAWAARYPEFAAVDPTLVALYFNEATLYARNDGGGPVCDSGVQSTLLNMLTAHICQINAPPAPGQTASQLVGRISSATEGSVSVQTQNDFPPGSPQWFQTTKYGAAYWAASAGYRTMRYARGPGSYRGPMVRPYGFR